MDEELKTAMVAIPMRGDPIAYRQRIADYENGFRAATKAPEHFIVVCIDALTQAIYLNTDASIADARQIINAVRKITDDEIYRAVSEAEQRGE